MKVRQVVREFKERLEEVYKDNLKGVILFGSAARGEFKGESDIDVLVILGNIANHEGELNKVFNVQREIERKYEDKIIISAILTTLDDYDSKLDPLYLNVKREGVTL
ncbi:MAG: nucleotidyltransferase domain-containing protein [Candidatus Brocadiaceae bacterium]|nr:nucleotidyltransferase domain-containing protein [Candidatus Brocadiaceae bacterium]